MIDCAQGDAGTSHRMKRQAAARAAKGVEVDITSRPSRNELQAQDGRGASDRPPATTTKKTEKKGS